MKKFLLIGICALGLCGCSDGNAGYNKQIFDLNQEFNYAIIERCDGEQVIEIVSWKDYENSDTIQFTDKDGRVWYTHSSKVILTNKMPN